MRECNLYCGGRVWFFFVWRGSNVVVKELLRSVKYRLSNDFCEDCGALSGMKVFFGTLLIEIWVLLPVEGGLMCALHFWENENF